MPKLISTNPKNGQPIGSVEISTLEDVQNKVAAAHQAKRGWQELGIEGRIAKLKKAVDQFEQDKDKIASLISQEMGKTIPEALSDIEGGLHYFRSYFETADKYLKPLVTHETATELHVVHHEPYGVAAVIVPWNYPFCNFVWQCGQNLVAGNTIVFKHSEETPLTGQAIEECFKKHLPSNVFSEVYGDGSVGQMLIEQDVNLICFTGSCKTGIHINKSAAARFIKTNMELGGSAPGIVFADADLDAVLPTIYRKRFSNCGQICDALKRLIVHENLVEKVIAKLSAELKNVVIGDPGDAKTTLGPLVAQRQLELLKAQVDDALQKGAKALVFGTAKTQGAYYQPTLLTNISKEMRVWREEVFGPVLPIIPFKTEAEALSLANDTQYGLGASIFTQDKNRFARIAKELESGMVSQNALNYVHTSNPFGGRKLSGNGREHAQFGFLEVTQTKIIAKEK